VGWKQCLPFLKSCDRGGVKLRTEGRKRADEVLRHAEEGEEERTRNECPAPNAVPSARGAAPCGPLHGSAGPYADA
jgi:hypothetical protein